LAGDQHVDAQEQVGDGMRLDGRKEVFGAVQDAGVGHAGDNARQPAVVLEAEGQGNHDKAKPGEPV